LSLGESAEVRDAVGEEEAAAPAESTSSMTTAEWREQNLEEDGTVSLWVEDDFNAGSRVMGGVDGREWVDENLAWAESVGQGTATTHAVTIKNHRDGTTLELVVPEDRAVLFEAESQGYELPMACRMGCCTQCAVKVISGELDQPQALGVSAKLKEEGYALMCVAYPRTELVVETQDPDEVYMMQFGEAFESSALDPNGQAIKRDDFALEIADMDE